ncbi:MAG: peptide-binding protein [Phycisphaerae bacterium]|nr:peptide-binding protein [Phycisphaerae bacterium]MDD5381915.1 peptide-binding protein [Phycisphaerae bacterium]
MNGRSGLFKFFLFLFLFVIILLQFLSMIQSDRLYKRLDTIIRRLENAPTTRTAQPQQEPKISEAKNLPMAEVPGDDGDWLVWRLSAEPRTLNTISDERDVYTTYITGGSIFERLLEYDWDEVELKPWLAESYELSKDGLEMTVRLRDGVCFSDGVPMTADDIIFTYRTIMNPGVDAAVQRTIYSTFKDVIKIDERTVKFVFTEVLWKTFEAVGLFEVFPQHIYDFNDPAEFNKHRSNPVGSGPYEFERWDVGQQVVLKRNENYWGYKPKLKKVVFRFILNDAAALQALRAGEIDFTEPEPEQYSEMKSNKEFTARFRAMSYWQPGVPFFYIAWNETTPFFADKRVRLAMTHIIDREAIVKHLLSGEAMITTGPFYIFGSQYDPNIKPWPYDSERAKQLLDEAGWIDHDGDGIRDKDGVKFSFRLAFATGRVFYEQLAKLFKDTASTVGVEVIADPYEWSVFTQKYRKHDFDALAIGSGGTVEFDPYQYFHSSQIAGGGDNCTSYNNLQADALIDVARRTLDPEKRYPLYHRFHRLIHEDQPFTFLYIRPEWRFLDKRFENVIEHKLGLNPNEWYVPRDKQRYK